MRIWPQIIGKGIWINNPLKQRADELKSQLEREQALRDEQRLKLANQLGTRGISLPGYVNSHDIMRLPIFSTKYARNGRQHEPIVFISQNGEIQFTVFSRTTYRV